MTMPLPAATGRGAWTQRGNRLGRALYLKGCSYSQPSNQDGWAVKQGVLAIQKLLVLNNIPLDYSSGPGIFGSRTNAAVLAFQKANVPPADGLVGRNTMKALLRGPVSARENNAGMPRHYLWGIIGAESAFDPGAVGYTTPYDIGLVQINTKVVTVGYDYPMDPVLALDWATDRMRSAYLRFTKYKGIDPWLAAVLNHHAPAWAASYATTGVWPNDRSLAYVNKVREMAATF